MQAIGGGRRRRLSVCRATHAARFDSLLDELGRRKMTNVLVEGGSQLLRTMFDAQLVDEVHVFIAPRTIGGDTAAGPVGGGSANEMAAALGVESQSTSSTATIMSTAHAERLMSSEF